MSGKILVALRLVPMLSVMVTIFLLSHQQGDTLSLPEIPFVDKAGHFALYGLLALSVLFIPSRQVRMSRPGTIIGSAMLICFLYGLSDEYHQTFIPGRFASPADIAADLCGAAAVCLLWRRRQRLMR